MSFNRPVFNYASYNAVVNLTSNQKALSKSVERLSSGLRVNRAADDAAGLAVSEGMRAQIRGTTQALRNAQDGISFVQTTEGGLNEIQTILQRMRELAVQSANGIYSATDRANIDLEVQQNIAEISRISAAVKFNGTSLLSAAATVTFQIGASTTANDVISVATVDASSTGLAVNTVAVTSVTLSTAAMTSIDTALQSVSAFRATLGAKQNRLESTINNLNVTNENLLESESAIRNTDFAQETSEMTRRQVLIQAGTSVAATSNALTGSVLSLLRSATGG